MRKKVLLDLVVTQLEMELEWESVQAPFLFVKTPFESIPTHAVFCSEQRTIEDRLYSCTAQATLKRWK
jgi:hypothetical protein